MNPWATRRTLNRTTCPWAFWLIVKISLNLIGLVVRLVTKGPNTLCFLKEEYLTFKASNHWGQSGLDLASSSITWSKSKRVERFLWRLRGPIPSILGEGRTKSKLRFWGKTLMGDKLAPSTGLWVILTMLLKPSCNFSMRDLRCRSLLSSKTTRAIQGLGF